MNIYEYFNSRDIAEYCRSIEHTFTATETAYIVWHSNHHTLADKHKAWREIGETMPDEQFHPTWDFGGHTLHSFLRAYMRLQNEFIRDFGVSRDDCVYTCAYLMKNSDQFTFDDIFYDSYDTCLNDMTENVIDSDTCDEIAKVEIIRHQVYSSHISFRDAKQCEAIVFDKRLRPLDISPADYETGDDRRFLGPSYGFYEIWVAIPTPFQRGDIVTDVNNRVPFILNRLPYWRRDSGSGDNCGEEIERLLNSGVDWTDMQELIYLQDDNGEIYWDHAFNYLDLEYYRDELMGKASFLSAVSSFMKGKISTEDLLRSHSVILMEAHASKMRRYFRNDRELMTLCGLEAGIPECQEE